jgi:hypothetical protein
MRKHRVYGFSRGAPAPMTSWRPPGVPRLRDVKYHVLVESCGTKRETSLLYNFSATLTSRLGTSTFGPVWSCQPGKGRVEDVRADVVATVILVWDRVDEILAARFYAFEYSCERRDRCFVAVITPDVHARRQSIGHTYYPVISSAGIIDTMHPEFIALCLALENCVIRFKFAST